MSWPSPPSLSSCSCPRGSLVAKPALVGDRVELDRVATLEDARFARPDSVDAALALGDAYLRADHPDWALATTAPFVEAGDHRVHLLRATAWADRMQPVESVAESARGEAACDKKGRPGVTPPPARALAWWRCRCRRSSTRTSTRARIPRALATPWARSCTRPGARDRQAPGNRPETRPKAEIEQVLAGCSYGATAVYCWRSKAPMSTFFVLVSGRGCCR